MISKKQIQIIFIFSVLSIFFYYLTLPYPFRWDEFGYLRNIDELKPSTLFTGRITFIYIHWFFSKIIPFFPGTNYQLFSALNSVAGLLGIWFFLVFLKSDKKPWFFYLIIFALMIFDEIFVLSISTLLPDALMFMFGMASLVLYEKFLDSQNKKVLFYSIILFLLGVTCREYIIYFLIYPLLRYSKRLSVKKATAILLVTLISIVTASFLLFPQFKLLFEGFFRVMKWKPDLVFLGIKLNSERIFEHALGGVILIFPVLAILLTTSKNYTKSLPWEKIIFLTFPCFVFIFTFVNGLLPVRYLFWGYFVVIWMYASAVEFIFNLSIWRTNNIIHFRKYVIALLFAPFITNLIAFNHNYSMIQNISLEKKSYYQHLSTVLTENTVMVAGENSSLVYLFIQEKKRGDLIWSGWAWNSDGYFYDHVSRSLNEGKLVLLDLKGITIKREIESLRKSTKYFRYVKFDRLFHQIIFKNRNNKT
jgi:hypothetical protein